MQNSLLSSCLSILVFHFSRKSARLKYRRALLWQALNTLPIVAIYSDQIRTSTSGWCSIWLMVILNENIHPAGQLAKSSRRSAAAQHLIRDRHWAQRFCFSSPRAHSFSGARIRRVISLEAAKGERERRLYICSHVAACEMTMCMVLTPQSLFLFPGWDGEKKSHLSSGPFLPRGALCTGAVPHCSSSFCARSDKFRVDAFRVCAKVCARLY